MARCSLRIVEDNCSTATFSLLSINDISYRLRIELNYYTKNLVEFRAFLLSGTSRTVIKGSKELDEEGDYLEVFSTKTKDIRRFHSTLRAFFIKTRFVYGVRFAELRSHKKIIEDTIYRMVDEGLHNIDKYGFNYVHSKYTDFDLNKSIYSNGEPDKLLNAYNGESNNVFPKCKYKIGFSTDFEEGK